MDRNLGASFSLSVLTVLTFAVILYRPDPARTPPAAAVGGRTDPGTAEAAPVEVVEAHPPESTIDFETPPPLTPIELPEPPSPLVFEPRPAARILPAPSPPMVPGPPRIHEPRRASDPTGTFTPSPLAVSDNPPTPAPSPRRARQAGPAPAVPSAPKGPPTVPAPAAPRPASGAFTQVLSGETLTAVALRVYGDGDRAEALWRANRDRLDRPDSPLESGMMLRTP